MMLSQSQARRGLAGLLGLISLALGVLTLVVDRFEFDLITSLQWVFQVSAIIVGLVLSWKRPDNRMGIVIISIVLGFAMMGAGQSVSAVLRDSGNTPGAVGWIRLEGFGFTVFVISLLILLPLWFPTGQARSQLGQWVVRLAFLIAGVGMIVDVLAVRTCIQWAEGQGCVWWVDGALPVFDEELPELIRASLLLLGLVAISGMIVRFVGSVGDERRQMKWLVWSLGILAIAAVAAEVADVALDWLVWVATTLVPVSIAVAVLRYRLYDIDRIISRTVSYAAIVGLLGVVFAAGVVWIPNLVPGLGDSSVSVAGSTLVVAALFNPLRKRVQSLVGRRFNRSRYDAERVVEAFAGSLRDRIDPDGLVVGWVGVVSDTMEPSAVGVWTR